jgi:hypothetical protein
MVVCRGVRRWRLLAFVGATVYGLFLLTAPFGHHDPDCHLKTPQHCTACASSVVGSDPHTPRLPGLWQLADAGSAFSVLQPVHGILLPVRSTGRSPPLYS